MSRSRSWLAILLVGAAVIVAWAATKRAAAARRGVCQSHARDADQFAQHERQSGADRVDAGASGTCRRHHSRPDQPRPTVAKDQPLVELDTRVASADLAKAQAAIQEAKAQEQVWTQGGRIAERQQIDADLARARLDMEAAQKNYQALDRLVAKASRNAPGAGFRPPACGSAPVENPGARKKQGPRSLPASTRKSRRPGCRRRSPPPR